MKKKLSVLLAILMILTLFVGCSASSPNSSGTNSTPDTSTNKTEQTETPSETYNLKVGTIAAAGTTFGQSMEYFKQIVEERSEGRITVDVYHSNQLGDTNTQIEGVIMGTQDLFITGIDPWAQWAPTIKYCGLNFLFRDGDHLVKFLTSDLFQPAIDDLAKNNMIFLDDEWHFINGPTRVLCSNVPVKSIEDYKNLKIRVADTEVFKKTMAALDAVPIALSWGDVYLGMQQGMIQAVEGATGGGLVADSFGEIAQYYTLTHSMQQRSALVMNKAKFDSMPEDLQQLLRQAAYDAGDEFSRLVEEAAAADKQTLIEEYGATFIEDMDLEPFYERMEATFAEWEESGFLEPGMVAKIQALA